MMLIENTISKLQEMKMATMAKAFREQLTDTNITSLPFEDRFGLIVDQEWTSRKNNHLKRLIKQAKFSDAGACVEDIEYHADRNLDKTQIGFQLVISLSNITIFYCLEQPAVVKHILLVLLVCQLFAIFFR